MKRSAIISFLLVAFVALSCDKEVDAPLTESYPEGTPVTMYLPFSTPDNMEVEIGTKAEASQADESNVHDLFVLLFDSSGNWFYKRYFTYEHMVSSLETLDSQKNDAWYVNLSEGSRVGAVKMATEAHEGCTLVVIANVSNTISSLDGSDPVSRLSSITTLEQLQSVKVTLEQETVNRSDLFLMMGVMTDVNTGTIKWGTLGGGYNQVDSHYQVQLKTVDAKVKFYVTYDPTNFNVEKCSPRYWKVYNAPSKCYLFEHEENPEDVSYFDTEEYYFEGTETTTKIVDAEEVTTTWQVFTFYILENRQSINVSNAIEPEDNYYLRELQDKDSDPENPGYYKNGSWVHAPEDATYVQFDVMLNLTLAGIANILESDAKHALTSEALFTVHMGDFSARGYDEYDVERSHFYKYYVTVNNSKKIYVEVMGDPGTGEIREDQPGQEGSLLLAMDDLVNCDAHYESHSMTFVYTPGLAQKGVSWYVKTPFSEGGAEWNSTKGDWDFDCKDYLWVKFSVNDTEDNRYLSTRMQYPGDNAYEPAWTPDSGDPRPDLLDIHQLIQYIFDQTDKEDAGIGSDFRESGDPDNNETTRREDLNIKVTAFIDEFYYEKDPRTYTYIAPESKKVDPESGDLVPDLWREFVNAQPRELHILAESRYSQDRKSNVITSSHSIIQQSIQTFYNTYSPDLTSLWGTEHKDEMSYASRYVDDPSCSAWDWWPGGSLPEGTSIQPDSEENGRQNSASLWGLYSTDDSAKQWATYLDYHKDNKIPQLKSTPTDYQYLAYSCLTRNRDNDGDGTIDPEEVRWYTASINQLVGMWVGNESLSPSARLYQPNDEHSTGDGLKWRSWVISSTRTYSPIDHAGINNPYVIRGEEGATKSNHFKYSWASFTEDQRNQVSSIRCVRNIGTFHKDGKTTDISYAPYDWIVDQYYEIPAGTDANGKAKPNADGTYTVRFSRLNPKSIREYMENDLPSHTEYSVHNMVYLEMNIQNPANYVYADGSFPAESEETVNDKISEKGYNTYCPIGYRLPNMTELVLMSAIQPSSFWTNGLHYPCRTYYSRGKKGTRKTTGETDKVGWQYISGQVNTIKYNETLGGVRCVRDKNNTGEITGKVVVMDGDRLTLSADAEHPKQTVVKLNFSSAGSTITSLALTLVYVDTDGVEGLIEIPTTGVELSGVSLIQDINWVLPTYDQVPVLGNLVVRASLRNAAGVSRTFETPVRVLSPVFTSVRLMHCEYSETQDNPDFPVLLTATSPSEDITGANLYIYKPDGDFEKVALSVNISDKNHWSYIYHYAYNLGDLQTGTYRFLLEVITNSQVTRSEYASMDVLKVNYTPNPTPVTPWTDATEVTGKWERQEIQNMDFYAGDFVEANMDVSACTFKQVKTGEPASHNNNLSIWRDNLISVGLTDTDYKENAFSVPYVLHINYPDHEDTANPESGKDWLRVNLTTQTSAANEYRYRTFSTADGSGFVTQNSNAKPKASANQHFRLDKNGIYWNNQKLDLSQWGGGAVNAQATFDKILTANNLYVGSTQGYHRSRATYHFVRAVHNSILNNATGGDVSGFDDNPENGGEL